MIQRKGIVYTHRQTHIHTKGKQIIHLIRLILFHFYSCITFGSIRFPIKRQTKEAHTHTYTLNFQVNGNKPKDTFFVDLTFVLSFSCAVSLCTVQRCQRPILFKHITNLVHVAFAVYTTTKRALARRNEATKMETFYTQKPLCWMCQSLWNINKLINLDSACVCFVCTNFHRTAVERWHGKFYVIKKRILYIPWFLLAFFHPFFHTKTTPPLSGWWHINSYLDSTPHVHI